MARSSLANSSSKLNLSQCKAAWLKKTIKVGNGMAEALRQLESATAGSQLSLAASWNELMVELVEMML